jgi:aminoglycoside 2''-phosphotransferase
MLDKLMTIPWYEMYHAYGQAEQVPIWLRQLTSHNEHVAEDAMSTLENSVLHQGSIYPSTAYTVPFLLELLQEPIVLTQVKADILQMLAAIVTSSYQEGREERRWDVEISSRVPFKHAGQEVCNGLPIYVTLLGDSHPGEIRVWAAYLIVLLATLTSTINVDQREHLITRLQMVSPLVEEKIVQERRVWKVAMLVETLLFLWFPRNEQVTQWTQVELTTHQHRVLSLFYDYDFSDDLYGTRFSYGMPEILQTYETYGVPGSREVLADLLGREPSPPAPRPLLPESTIPDPDIPSYANGIGHHFGDLCEEQFHTLYPDLFVTRWGDISGPAGNLLEADVNSFRAYVHRDNVRSILHFHIPDSPAAVWEMKREYQLLRLLQGRVPPLVPHPLYASVESNEPGEVFMGYQWFSGAPLYKETWENLEGAEDEEIVRALAHHIASFLYTLHQIPVTDLAQIALPMIHQRTSYETLFTRVRLDLCPHLPKDRREQLVESFTAFLNTAHNFTLTPALVHGSFGPRRILYDGTTQAISGVIGFTHAGLGDPAYDIAPLFGPQGYGKPFRQFFEEAYPNLPLLRERIQFYVNASLLQDAFSRYGQQYIKNVAHEFTFYRVE